MSAFNDESARRQELSGCLDHQIYLAQMDRSPASLAKLFGPFGTATFQRIIGSRDGWHVHIRNEQFGAVLDANIIDNGSSGDIEYSREIMLHTLSWQIYTGLTRWFSLLASVLLLGGIIGFLLPRSLRSGAMMVAALALTTSLVSVDEQAPAHFNLWSIAPAITLALCCLAMIWPQRKIDPIKCRKCGYDLTGNVSGVCPECGTPRRLHNLDSLVNNLDQIT